MKPSLTPPSSKRANSNSLREQVYNDLRMAILRGKIVSGTRLVESVLAVEMGVSRTPIREALHKLDLEELVYSMPRVGYIVNDMTEYDIEDLFLTRTAIEQLAARWALEKITPEEIERLEDNLKKTERILSNGLTKKMIDLDTEFHEIICKASRSKRLYQISQILRDHMLKFRISCLHILEIAERARDGHFEILKAIKSKDPQKTDDSILQHMLETKKDILNYMKRLRENLA
jgi:DNA-binding GntR family transcriptional regulator